MLAVLPDPVNPPVATSVPRFPAGPNWADPRKVPLARILSSGTGVPGAYGFLWVPRIASPPPKWQPHAPITSFLETKRIVRPSPLTRNTREHDSPLGAAQCPRIPEPSYTPPGMGFAASAAPAPTSGIATMTKPHRSSSRHPRAAGLRTLHRLMPVVIPPGDGQDNRRNGNG